MHDTSRLSSVNGTSLPHRPQKDRAARLENAVGADTATQLQALADLSARVHDGSACLIAWNGAGDVGIVRAVSDTRLNSRLDSLLAAVERDQRHGGDRANQSDRIVRFGDGELAAAGYRAAHDRNYVAAAISITVGDDRATRATVIQTVPHQGAQPGFDPGVLAEITAHSAIAILQASAAHNSRNFWQARNSETLERLNTLKSESSEDFAERARIEEAVTGAAELGPRNRFSALGAIFAELGPFNGWILALADDGTLRVVATSQALDADTPIDSNSTASALGECFLGQTKIVSTRPLEKDGQTSGANLSAKSAAYIEDEVFARFAGYVCIPFVNGAIALAANETIDAATVVRIEAFAARVSPLIAKWLLEAETDRLRGLVQNLGLRMFGAIDSERARIARDMHDHQAQLLAAARIGIEAGPDQARAVFKQLEDAMRQRVRELKPPTLGRSTLAEALRFELGRLTATGIKTRLLHGVRMDALTRPIQQLCFQVAREALANVVRHADATRVEIDLENRGTLVRLAIFDNGKGIDNAGTASPTSINDVGMTGSTKDGKSTGARRGIGLDGLNERLALMGGRLRIESKAGSTRLIAEIPVPE